MPSDTFAAGIEAAARVCETSAQTSVPLMKGAGVSSSIETGRHRALTEAAADIRRLTPTDTDTAIPAGEVERIARVLYEDNPFKVHSEAQQEATGLGWGEAIPYDVFLASGGDDTPQRETIARVIALAASPKPDTDTPVDPGVEGVTLFTRCKDCGMNAPAYLASDCNRPECSYRLAAKPIAGMDAGEVERLRDRLAGGTANAYPMMFPALATNQEDGK